MRRTQWVDPKASAALALLALDERKGGEEKPNKRYLPACLYVDLVASFLHFDAPVPNQLYAVGGRNEQQVPLCTVEMFETWHGRWVTCPNMHVRRAGCAAAQMANGNLLVVGGYDERGIVHGLLNTCEIFDPHTQRWRLDSATLCRARWGHGSASLGGRVYAVGGCSLMLGGTVHESYMETLRSCEVYDPTEQKWSPCASLHVARAGARVVTLSDRYLAAVGGCDDVFGRAELLPTVELFDGRSGVWSVLSMQLSTPRTTAAVAALDERQIVIIGGAPSLSSGEVYRVLEQSDNSQCSTDSASVNADRTPIGDMTEGRMGCQAVCIRLPASKESYPKCDRQCVVVVGGESGDEDMDVSLKQFDSVLVYDSADKVWRAEDYFPPIPTPRTAMALCVGPGRIQGHR